MFFSFSSSCAGKIKHQRRWWWEYIKVAYSLQLPLLAPVKVGRLPVGLLLLLQLLALLLDFRFKFYILLSSVHQHPGDALHKWLINNIQHSCSPPQARRCRSRWREWGEYPPTSPNKSKSETGWIKIRHCSTVSRYKLGLIDAKNQPVLEIHQSSATIKSRSNELAHRCRQSSYFLKGGKSIHIILQRWHWHF